MIFFSPIEAPLPAHLGGLDRLAVDDPGARLGMTAQPLSGLLAQGIVDPDEDAGADPLIKVVPNSAPLGEVVRDIAPLTAGAQEIEDGVRDLSQVHLPGATHLLGGFDEGPHQLPLLVRQVTGVALPGRLGRHDLSNAPVS
jgi:hypothetical protein